MQERNLIKEKRSRVKSGASKGTDNGAQRLTPVVPKESYPSGVFHPYPCARALRLAQDYRQTLRESAFIEQALAEIAEMIERNNITALSFDVFDTALIRGPLSEARRFYQAGALFAQHCDHAFSASDALIARGMAAKAAYTFATPAADGTREGKFEVIAKIACAHLQVSARQNDYVTNELRYEQENLQVNPLVRAMMERFSQLKILFLSDMYLESDKIAGLLAPHYAGKYTVYSSADGHGSKRSKGLFDYALGQAGLTAAQVLHIGDNLKSDFQAAKQSGCHVFFTPVSDVERNVRQQCHAALADELQVQGVSLSSVLQFNC